MKNHSQETTSNPSEGPGARILVVEDEMPMRNVLKNTLERQGYRVLLAADGEEGLARAVKETPDLILLDVMMPRMSGFEVCVCGRAAS